MSHLQPTHLGKSPDGIVLGSLNGSTQLEEGNAMRRNLAIRIAGRSEVLPSKEALLLEFGISCNGEVVLGTKEDKDTKVEQSKEHASVGSTLATRRESAT